MAKKAAAPVSVMVAGHLDRELIQSAIKKRQSGGKATKDELRALARFEKAKEEADRWRFYGTIPKAHWVTMSGRSYKVLADHAATHAVPIAGREIDLAAVVKWLHRFLSDNSRKLAAIEMAGDPMLSAATGPAMERYRAAMATLREMDVAERRNQLIPRHEIHDGLTRISSILRGVGAVLQRAQTLTGNEARQILDEGLDDCERLIRSLCGPQLERTREAVSDAKEA